MIFLVQSGGVPHLYAQLNVSDTSRATRLADHTSWWVAFEPSKGVGKVNINEIADLPIINFRASLGTKQVRISLQRCQNEWQTCSTVDVPSSMSCATSLTILFCL